MHPRTLSRRAIGVGLVIALGCCVVFAPVPTASAQAGTPSATPAPLVHVVQAGEYLSVIAARYGVTTQELADANDMRLSDILAIGRELIIPGADAEPTATPMPTVTPTPEGGRIVISVFEDANGNGLRDAGEPNLTGARVQLLDATGQVLAEHISDGSPESWTFEALPPATYSVREEDPAGYTSTSANAWTVPLGIVTEMEVFFGDRAVVPATPAPNAPAGIEAPSGASTPAEGGAMGSRGLSDYSGILVAVVAIALPFGFRALRGRQ